MDEHFYSMMKLLGPMLDRDFNPGSPVDRTLAFRALRDSIMDEEYYKMMGAADPSVFRPTFIPFAEFQRQTKEYSRQIFAHWNRLHDILDHHEDQLRKRWIKKSREQRTRILTNTWPNMPATHRPDFSLQRDSKDQLAAREIRLSIRKTTNSIDDRQVAPGRIQVGRILEHCGRTLYSKNGQVNPSNIIESLDPSNARTDPRSGSSLQSQHNTNFPCRGRH